jgi:hypothetical protein
MATRQKLLNAGRRDGAILTYITRVAIYGTRQDVKGGGGRHQSATAGAPHSVWQRPVREYGGAPKLRRDV